MSKSPEVVRVPSITQIIWGVALLALAVLLPVVMAAIGQLNLLATISSAILAVIGYLLLDIFLSAAGEIVVELIGSWRPFSRGFVGAEAEAQSDDRVLLKGAIWRARSDLPLSAGDKVRVISVRGLTLRVKKDAPGIDRPPDAASPE